MAYYQEENYNRDPQRFAASRGEPIRKNNHHPQAQPQQNPNGQRAKQAPTTPSAPAEAPAAKNEAQSETGFISTQIWKVNGKDKVVDFSSKLVKAYAQDFANIHGIGGADHATNSTICVTLCDYTKGKGDKSVTLKYCIDVEDVAQLFHAAKMACIGQLTAPAPASASVNGEAIAKIDSALAQMRKWLKIEPYPDNSRPIQMDELTSVGKALSDALASLKQQSAGGTNTVTYSYTRQKNHAYADSISKVNGVPHAPVQQISIFYDPTRRYPWTIQISNYDAPIKQQANGATTHNASKAINKREAFINLSADDFCAAMVAVDRFIRLWEQRMYRIVDAGCTRYEKAIEELKSKKSGNGK